MRDAPGAGCVETCIVWTTHLACRSSASRRHQLDSHPVVAPLVRPRTSPTGGNLTSHPTVLPPHGSHGKQLPSHPTHRQRTHTSTVPSASPRTVNKQTNNPVSQSQNCKQTNSLVRESQNCKQTNNKQNMHKNKNQRMRLKL